jgi:hypothetical protein
MGVLLVFGGRELLLDCVVSRLATISANCKHP